MLGSLNGLSPCSFSAATMKMYSRPENKLLIRQDRPGASMRNSPSSLSSTGRPSVSVSVYLSQDEKTFRPQSNGYNQPTLAWIGPTSITLGLPGATGTSVSSNVLITLL